MFPIAGVLSGISSLAGSANASSPQAIENTLNAKTNPVFSNSFAVGRGATATSSPNVSAGEAAAGIPPAYILGGAVLLALLVAVAVRK